MYYTCRCLVRYFAFLFFLFSFYFLKASMLYMDIYFHAHEYWKRSWVRIPPQGRLFLVSHLHVYISKPNSEHLLVSLRYIQVYTGIYRYMYTHPLTQTIHRLASTVHGTVNRGSGGGGEGRGGDVGASSLLHWQWRGNIVIVLSFWLRRKERNELLIK